VTKEGASPRSTSDTSPRWSPVRSPRPSRWPSSSRRGVLDHVPPGKRRTTSSFARRERTILAVIFDDRTTLGMVRLYSSQVSSKLGEVFKDISRRKTEGEKISQDLARGPRKAGRYIRELTHVEGTTGMVPLPIAAAA